MTETPLDLLPLWTLFPLTLGVIWVALEVGLRLGQWRRVRAGDEKDGPLGAAVAAILGLVAFMLAFTFGLAASRFDDKRMTVLEEANAIGTCYLRARLLPEPHNTQVAKLLREYVDVRVRGVQEGQLPETVAQSEKLQELLWQQAVQAADQSPTIITGLFVQSLNEVIDVHSKRMLVGMRSRIPLIIWVSLFAIAFIGIAAVGYQAGLSETRRSPAMLGLVLAFTCVLFLIEDLDRGREGLLRVDQTAMTDLQKSMHQSE